MAYLPKKGKMEEIIFECLERRNWGLSRFYVAALVLNETPVQCKSSTLSMAYYLLFTLSFSFVL